MKIIKSTGLVPVYEPKNANHIFGVQPDVAFDGWKNSTLILVDIPEEYETDDVPVPEYDDRDQPNAKKGAEPERDGELIVIPEDWEDKHWMTQDKLAKAIAGESYAVPAGVRGADHNKVIIREELARREEAKEA